MSGFQQKVYKEKKAVICQETNKTKPGYDTGARSVRQEIDRKIKITMINILKILIGKVNNMRDQMGVFSRVENYKKK